MNIRYTLMAVAACVIGSTSVAHAETALRETTQVVVSVKGIDFADQESVAGLDAVLHRAAVIACDSGEPNSLSARSEDARCTRESWEAAVNKLGQPLLSQLHGHGIALAQNSVANPAAKHPAAQ